MLLMTSGLLELVKYFTGQQCSRIVSSLDRITGFHDFREALTEANSAHSECERRQILLHRHADEHRC